MNDDVDENDGELGRFWTKIQSDNCFETMSTPGLLMDGFFSRRLSLLYWFSQICQVPVGWQGIFRWICLQNAKMDLSRAIFFICSTYPPIFNCFVLKIRVTFWFVWQRPDPVLSIWNDFFCWRFGISFKEKKETICHSFIEFSMEQFLKSWQSHRKQKETR